MVRQIPLDIYYARSGCWPASRPATVSNSAKMHSGPRTLVETAGYLGAHNGALANPLWQLRLALQQDAAGNPCSAPAASWLCILSARDYFIGCQPEQHVEKEGWQVRERERLVL